MHIRYSAQLEGDVLQLSTIKHIQMWLKTLIFVAVLATISQSVPVEVDLHTVCIGQPDNAYVRSATSCRHYLICSEGKVLTEAICDEGQSFEVADQACGPLNEAICMDYEDDPYESPDQDDSMLTEKEIEDKHQRPELMKQVDDMSCQDVPDGVLVPSPRSCRHYYRCYAHESTKAMCPEGFAFNEERQRCDPEDEVDCILCPLADGGSKPLYNPQNCNTFFMCGGGMRMQFACGAGMRFTGKTCRPRIEVPCNVGNICRYHDSNEENFLVRDVNDCRK